MPKSLIFWVLMLLWLIFGLWAYWPLDKNYVFFGGNLLQFVLFALLGWQVYGPAVT